MAKMASTGPTGSREPGASAGSRLWVQESKELAHLRLLFQVTNGEPNQKWSSQDLNWSSHGMLVLERGDLACYAMGLTVDCFNIIKMFSLWKPCNTCIFV